MCRARAAACRSSTCCQCCRRDARRTRAPSSPAFEDDRHGDDLLPERLGLAQCVLGQPRDPVDRARSRWCASAPASPASSSMRRSLAGPLVVGVDAEEEEDEGRDGDDDDPGALGELGDQEDDGGDGGDARAEAVDDGPASPTRRARSRRQCTTSPACDSVNPMKTPMAKRGISVLVLPSTAIEERARHDGEHHDAVARRSGGRPGW